MTKIKYIGAVIFGVIIILLVVVNFSEKKTILECQGEISLNGSKDSLKLYAQLGEYRPWVSLWSDSRGNLQIEIPNEFVRYFGDLRSVGQQIQIYDTYPGGLKGNYSQISKTLSLETGVGFFDGTCLEKQ